MVRHEHVGVDMAGVVAGVFLQPMEIEAVVLDREKARLSIVPALNDMDWYVGKNEAGATGNGGLVRYQKRHASCCPKSVTVRAQKRCRPARNKPAKAFRKTGVCPRFYSGTDPCFEETTGAKHALDYVASKQGSVPE